MTRDADSLATPYGGDNLSFLRRGREGTKMGLTFLLNLYDIGLIESAPHGESESELKYSRKNDGVQIILYLGTGSE